jgi:hypothetical protein
MANKIYLVKKDPHSKKQSVEWLQLSGSDFYAFLHTPEAKGRYFIHLTDDIDFECDEIYIEADRMEYREWKKKYNAHNYLAERQKSTEVISLEALLESEKRERDADSLQLDSRESLEQLIVHKDEIEQLYAALNRLTAKEQDFVRYIYLSGEKKTEADAARQFGISNAAAHRLKEKIFLQIQKFMRKKSEKSQQ